ncbi:MAG TPA: hypothetical protein PLJ35_20225, partial [Anaerolineae bacterium]|nr:hypothetical protein [Anaerolineae bacterium]
NKLGSPGEERPNKLGSPGWRRMNVVSQFWEATDISVEGVWALAGLGLFALLFIALTLRARLGRPFAIRPLAAAECIRAAFARATETGEAMQVALGSGGLGDPSTADTLAGLYLTSYLARRAALAEVPVRVRVAEATALAGALAAMQHSAVSTGYPEAFDPGQVEFVAPQPLAYAAGVAAAIHREPLVANAMVGRYGAEVLLPGQAGVAQGLVQVGGTSDPTALPLFVATVQAPLLGEEIYALGAALGRHEHTGSLATQDVFRALIAFGILLAAVLGVLGIRLAG